jgi:hypothetical protein
MAKLVVKSRQDNQKPLHETIPGIWAKPTPFGHSKRIIIHALFAIL